jgi:nucleoside-diphosphate-sugar epimerase
LAAFVTGGTGFIGSRLVRRLIEAGETVHLLAREHSDLSGLMGAGVSVFGGDVTDAPSLRPPVEGCRTVYHLAGYARNWARDPAVYTQVNVQGLRNAAEAALGAGVERFVFTSSCMSFGPSNGGPMDEETHRRTDEFLTEYERSKFLAEAEAQRLFADGLSIVTVNPTRVYGPGRLTEGNSVTRMVDMFLRGKFPAILGKGADVGNYVYVDDVVDAHLKAAERGRPGQKYLAAGENCSLAAFFALVAELSARQPPRFHMPAAAARLFGHVEALKARAFGSHPLITPGWVETFLRDWAFSNRKAVEELGCTFRPMREGLAETIAWLGLRPEDRP